MSKLNYTGVPMYYIQFRNTKTGTLSDISVVGYESLELCQAQFNFENKVVQEFEHEILAKYEEDLKKFVLDNDTCDREPINPLKLHWRCDKNPHQYIFDESGYHEITEHIIKDLNLLQATPELLTGQPKVTKPGAIMLH